MHPLIIIAANEREQRLAANGKESTLKGALDQVNRTTELSDGAGISG
jgi:hypothetical protein